jgi:hypothetical protein
LKISFKIATTLTFLAAIACIAGGTGTHAKGAVKKATSHAVKKAQAPVCPVCKMALSSVQSVKYNVAVQTKKDGPVMFCCTKCKMPKKMIADVAAFRLKGMCHCHPHNV